MASLAAAGNRAPGHLVALGFERRLAVEGCAFARNAVGGSVLLAAPASLPEARGALALAAVDFAGNRCGGAVASLGRRRPFYAAVALERVT